MFDCFLAAPERNRVYDASCSTQSVHKPVLQSRQQVLRAYCPNTYTVILCEQKLSREGEKKREAHLVNLDVSWRFDLGTIHVEIKKLLKDWV